MVAGSASCPFCGAPGSSSELVGNEHALAMSDRFPVSRGHALVIPRRHVLTIFDLSQSEQLALWELVVQVKELLAAQHHPDGLNVGTNAGLAAGQTVLHAHVHVIPRYQGDVDDPWGGVR